jgi:hypothetical protein
VDVSDGSGNDNTSTATLKSIIDVYAKRSEWETSAKAEELADFQLKEAGGGELLGLNDFAQMYYRYVGMRGQYSRNKIKKSDEKSIVNFTPSLSNQPDSPKYAEYCKLALIRYKPWSGENSYVNKTDQEVTQEWHHFVTQLDEPPDYLVHQIRRLMETAAANPDDIGLQEMAEL